MSENSRTILILVAVTIVCLLPFAGKAVHIDDPLFIWTAKQILQHPLDPYGFRANWYGADRPMYAITKNPPGASYILALAGVVAGWGEGSLHAFMLIPAIACVAGTYLLAKRFTQRPLEAALVALFSPVFLVSATTLMCDVLMLCCWIWALLMWMSGIDRRSWILLMCSAMLVAICAVVKYFGVAVIPLLAVWTISEKKRFDRSLFWLAVPVAFLCLYQWWTAAHYGRGLLIDAASYASTARNDNGLTVLQHTVVGLAFTGGCFAAPLFYSTRLWNARSLKFAAIGLLVLAVLWIIEMLVTGSYPVLVPEVSPSYIVQFIVWTAVGLILVLMVLFDLNVHRDRESVFLASWILGTLVFAVVLNWTVNGRTLLPLIPAAAILMMRRCTDCAKEGDDRSLLKRYLPLGLLAVLSLLVTYADYALANGIRRDVETIWSHPRSQSSSIWYEGHWGFQYYMDQAGGKALDIEHPQFSQGDIVIVPVNNSFLYQLPEPYFPIQDSLVGAPPFPVATMNAFARAGFYSDFDGQLPFVFGRIPPEKYEVHIVVQGNSSK
ncbi:MAG TPA: glycosyltransferase family 39 protein [Bacteroidota bacterium]|nr:glycosyltransferase family 39 protein [Bacteroidota bacterium]